MAKRELNVKVNLEFSNKEEFAEKINRVQENVNKLVESVTDLVEFEVAPNFNVAAEGHAGADSGAISMPEAKHGILIELPEITDEISESIKGWSEPLGTFTTSMLLLEIARRKKRDDQVNTDIDTILKSDQ